MGFWIRAWRLARSAAGQQLSFLFLPPYPPQPFFFLPIFYPFFFLLFFSSHPANHGVQGGRRWQKGFPAATGFASSRHCIGTGISWVRRALYTTTTFFFLGGLHKREGNWVLDGVGGVGPGMGVKDGEWGSVMGSRRSR